MPSPCRANAAAHARWSRAWPTADAACRAIRKRDPDGSIGLVGAEAHPPYARPPLTKALWKGTAEDSVWRRTEDVGVELELGRRIVTLDLVGAGAESGQAVATFATNDDPSVPGGEGITIAVGEAAHQFSDWPRGEESDFQLTSDSPGVAESVACLGL